MMSNPCLSQTESVVLLPHTAVGEAVERASRAKLYHRLGYRVFVSTDSQLKSNPEAFELLFQKNPFIRGEKSPDPSDLVDGIVTELNPFRRNSFNPRILQRDQFSAEQRRMEIHYRPQVRPELSSATLLDLNISSYRLNGGRDNFEKVEDFVRAHYPDGIAIRRKQYDVEVRGFEIFPVAEEFPFVEYESIYDYCDIVASCKRVVCFQTGAQYLACAYCSSIDLLRTENHNSRLNSRNRLLYFDCEIKDIDLR
ncbi:MAG: hypothetical protein MI807_22240 [Verrucomicrobiales bacterium]|nr:hypothetical protein [Verrucomicrobiales bacterium]